MSLYDFYEKRIFPTLMDRTMRGMEDLRGEALAAAAGDALEIGFGTGLNLRHYPLAVTSLAALDPMDALPDLVRERIEAAPFPVERHTLRADGGLPFDAGRFDTVAITWTMCTIPDVAAALLEMRRVLKADGRMVFVEHGRSDEPGVARWQDRVNPLWNVIGCGCNLNRPIDQLVAKAGFSIRSLERFVQKGTPRMFGSMYRGIASP